MNNYIMSKYTIIAAKQWSSIENLFSPLPKTNYISIIKYMHIDTDVIIWYIHEFTPKKKNDKIP